MVVFTGIGMAATAAACIWVGLTLHDAYRQSGQALEQLTDARKRLDRLEAPK